MSSWEKYDKQYIVLFIVPNRAFGLEGGLPVGRRGLLFVGAVFGGDGLGLSASGC